MNRITVAKMLSHRAINAMSTPQLTELLKVDKETVRIHRTAAKGCRGYFASDFARKEYNRAKYEIHAIEKELLRRQHAAPETTLAPAASAGVADRDAAQAVVAA